MKFWSLLLVFGFAQIVKANIDYSLVVSTGVLSSGHDYNAFFNSRIFNGENQDDFSLENTQPVFTYKGWLFVSDSEINADDVVTADSKITEHEKEGFIGHSYVGLNWQKNVSTKVERYLGASHAKHKIMARKNNNKTIYAVNFSGDQPLKWPSKKEQLTLVPAVVINDHDARAVVIARSVGDVQHKLGLVDSLRLKDPAAVYIDVGASNGEDLTYDDELLAALQKRNTLLMLGTSEMVHLLKDKESFKKLEHVYPFGEYSLRSLKGVNFLSLADQENERIWSLFKPLGKLVSIEEGIKNAIKRESRPERALNVVTVFSEKAAIKAAQSIYVDLVFLVSSDPMAQLPTREVVDVRDRNDSFEQMAPIVHLAPLSVAQVNLSCTTVGNISRVKIIRHSVTDHGPKATDISRKGPPVSVMVLPDLHRAWNQEDFDKVLGGLIIKNTHADVAIFEKDGTATPIKGGIESEIAYARLMRPGAVSIIETNGRQLKRIAGLIADNKFPHQFFVTGIDKKARQIRQRKVNDEEYYRVAVSEKALLEIFNVALVGGFSDQVAVRSSFIAGVYGRLENLVFLGGPSSVSVSETTGSIEEAFKEIKTQQTFAQLVAATLPSVSFDEMQQFIKQPEGKARHALLAKIDYLDFGFSQNVVNQSYKNFQDGEVNLPMSRGSADLFSHMLIFTKMSLIYDAPQLITTLGNGIRFLMVKGFDEKPTKDKVTLSLDFRLPWERSYFKDKSVIISPVFKNTYETKLAPLLFLSDNTEADWKKRKMLPRTSKIDSLLGFNVAMTNLGFEFDVGAMMSTDFTQKSMVNAIDIGPGFNFLSRWSLFGPFELSSEVSGSYLFALPKNTAMGKAALAIEGTAWLKLAHFYGVSVSVMSDFLFATIQDQPKNLAISSIFGLTISYGRLMRIAG